MILDIESLSDALEEIASVSYSTTKEEIVKESPQNWTDVPVQETMQDNFTFRLDDNNAQKSVLNDSVDGNTRRRRGHVSYCYHMQVDSQRKAGQFDVRHISSVARRH